MRICTLETCDNLIPKTRKKSSRYCSDNCYYEAKKLRSSRNYYSLKAPGDKIKQMESILAFAYQMLELRKTVLFDDLKNMGFDWGFSTKEVIGGNKQIAKAIGGYCYFINNDKSVLIWKLK